MKKEACDKATCRNEELLRKAMRKDEVVAEPEEACDKETCRMKQEMLQKIMKADGPQDKEVVPAPEESTPTLTAPPLVLEKEPEPCYKKKLGEEATFLEIAKDYFNQFKAMPAQKHWICVKNILSHKYSSVFVKTKIQPVVKDETPEVGKPAAVKSH